MKAIVAVLAWLWVCGPAHGLDLEKKLQVVSSVHANERVLVRDSEERNRKQNNCVDDGTRNEDRVCGSNGKLYLNMNRFKYNKCVIQAEMNEEITIADLAFCKGARLEDFQSEGLLPEAD